MASEARGVKGYDGEAGSAENAARMLPEMVKRWFAAGRVAAGAGMEEAAALHRFRLEGKRLRYAMELFAPCYGKAMEGYLGKLRKSQTWLGEFNDCAVAEKMIGGLEMGARSRGRALGYVRARSREMHEGFGKFWREELDVKGAEGRWVRYVGSPGGRRP